jgi:hypothetical protein
MENKTGKYLKYAIGEIVLVVIGILIALQINNWNEVNKENKLKVKYYHQLLSDMQIDQEFAKRSISILDSARTKYSNYKKTFEKPNLSIEEIMGNLINNEFNTLDLEYKTSTIETLINTGDIKIFNPKLRDLLTSYNKRKLQTIYLSRNNSKEAKDLLKEASLKGGAIIDIPRLQNQPILNRTLNFENRFPEIYLAIEAYLNWKDIVEGITIGTLKGDIDRANAIIEIIETELN